MIKVINLFFKITNQFDLLNTCIISGKITPVALYYKRFLPIYTSKEVCQK